MPMRVFAFIFSLYIIFLCFLPAVNLVAGSQEEIACCADGCSDEDNESKDSETVPENCNPFQSCCPGFNVLNNSAESFIELIVFKSFIECEESIPAFQTGDFWQPPKLIIA